MISRSILLIIKTSRKQAGFWTSARSGLDAKDKYHRQRQCMVASTPAFPLGFSYICFPNHQMFSVFFLLLISKRILNYEKPLGKPSALVVR
jgi:hypothetical protein